jgi:hypothetical protein
VVDKIEVVPKPSQKVGKTWESGFETNWECDSVSVSQQKTKMDEEKEKEKERKKEETNKKAIRKRVQGWNKELWVRVRVRVRVWVPNLTSR